jgi:hypothetical protein
MVPTPAGTVIVAVAFPDASVGVLWALMTCPAAVIRTVNGVPTGIFVVARLMVMFPAAVKTTSGVFVLPSGGVALPARQRW